MALSSHSCLSSTQGQFDGRAQDPRECPVSQPQQPQEQPRVVSPRAEGSGDRRDGDQAHEAVTGCCLHLRHRQGLSLQQRDRSSTLDLKGLTG